MEYSFWYAPSKYYVPVLSSSKTAPVRHLRAPDTAAGGAAFRVLPSLQRLAAHATCSQRAGSVASASLVRHCYSAIRHTEHVAGRCRQFLCGWIPQAALGLRWPGDDGAGAGPQEIEMRNSWSTAPSPPVVRALWDLLQLLGWPSTFGVVPQHQSSTHIADCATASMRSLFLFRAPRLAAWTPRLRSNHTTPTVPYIWTQPQLCCAFSGIVGVRLHTSTRWQKACKLDET